MDPELNYYLLNNYQIKKTYFKYCDCNIKASNKKVQLNFMKKCLEEKVAPRSLLPKQLKFNISNPFPKLLEETLKHKISVIKSEVNYWFSKSYKQLLLITNKIPQSNRTLMIQKMKNNLIYRKNIARKEKQLLMERKFKIIFQNSAWTKTATNNVLNLSNRNLTELEK